MAKKFEYKLKDKYRQKLFDEINEKFSELHDKDSMTANVETAFEFALDQLELREEKKKEIKQREKELEEEKEKWRID